MCSVQSVTYVSGTDLVVNGRGNPIIGELLEPHDTIVEFDPRRHRIIQKATEMYRLGSSTEEISRSLGIPKTSTREALQRNGVKVRSRRETAGHSHPPYGYVYIDGKLIPHPIEQKRIELILQLARRGFKAWRISEELSKLNISPRTGKIWCHKTIKKILNTRLKIND